MTEQIKPNWHPYNLWKDDIVYVPIEELAKCVVGGTITGKTPEDLVRIWTQQNRTRLDAYILPQPSGEHDLGVRYGMGEGDYYSPPNHRPDQTRWLLSQYRKKS